MQLVRQPHAQRHDTGLAARRDTTMRAHHRQLRARGKLGKVALIAYMRKLLTIVNARRRDELRVARGLSMAIRTRLAQDSCRVKPHRETAPA
ncbi:hypothetical protein [Luteimonas abyssi]|uniref:hypothetical protein n=1 Tax=Luteimonas abyssi TaxID=1247514 RepID=UPI0012FBB9B1